MFHLRAPSRHRISTASLVSTSTLTVPTSTTNKNHSSRPFAERANSNKQSNCYPTRIIPPNSPTSSSSNHAPKITAYPTHLPSTPASPKILSWPQAHQHVRGTPHARQVFDEITDRTIYVWNAIFLALALLGDGEEDLRLYRRTNSIGMSSDRFTYTYILKACVVSGSERPLRGKEVHPQVLRHGYERHLHVMTTLVDMYAKFRCVESARLVFDLMPAKNLVSWSAMIACFAKNARPLDALEVFREMMQEGGDDVLPNSVMLVSVIQACATLSALEQGKLIHGYVLRKGLDSILPVMNALVTMYA